MQAQASEIQRFNQAAFGEVDPLMLEEVGFKWLMTGHGWWVDSTRLHDDPEYADGFLQLAMTSNSFALRECADRLHKWKLKPA